jgi:hypothetical protein
MCSGTRVVPQIPEIVGQALAVLDREITGDLIDVREPQALIIDQPLHCRGSDLGHVVDLKDLSPARQMLKQFEVLRIADGHRFWGELPPHCSAPATTTGANFILIYTVKHYQHIVTKKDPLSGAWWSDSFVG